MARLVPGRAFEANEDGPGRYVCELEGGRITFTDDGGRVSVDVEYTTMAGYSTHIGPFDSLEDAAYRMTHGVIPRRLAALLLANGQLVRA